MATIVIGKVSVASAVLGRVQEGYIIPVLASGSVEIQFSNEGDTSVEVRILSTGAHKSVVLTIAPGAKVVKKVSVGSQARDIKIGGVHRQLVSARRAPRDLNRELQAAEMKAEKAFFNS